MERLNATVGWTSAGVVVPLDAGWSDLGSWDAVWGLSYDVPCFVAVQMAVAKALGVAVGRYRHHAGSFHL